MEFKVGDKVVWIDGKDDNGDIGTVKEVKKSEITITWGDSAGTQKYTEDWYNNITVVQRS